MQGEYVNFLQELQGVYVWGEYVNLLKELNQRMEYSYEHMQVLPM